MSVKEFTYNDIVLKIDHALCNGSADCVEECPVEVFELIDDKSHATAIEDCIECCVCVDVCPTGAIEHSSC